ncbi:MAG: hypothetical protein JNM30_09940 [Rhodospirillales bacterium]|nr:hypothetical protein [Rhodospirillales bacterium]
MKTRPISLFAALAALGLSLAAATAQAAVINAGRFSGTDCGGAGGFANCYAETTGVSQDAPGSPAIFKLNYGSGSFGNPDFGSFASITGSEFSVSFNTSSHVLSWDYTPGASDPEIHFFTIKQGNSHYLFYDLTSPITSFTIDLDTLGYNSLSHITWFDTGSTTTSVPGPNALALLGLGLLGLGVAARRRA